MTTADQPFEPCGAVFPLRYGQDPCRKPRDHHLGPDTDWKRDHHSNGLLKWRVDGADMPDPAKCLRCGTTAVLGRFDVCVPCAALCGWDPACEACQQDDAGGPVTVAHVSTCGGGLA